MTVVADASSKDYGKIRVLRMSDTQQVEGAGQAHNNILRDEKVASALRPYLNQGSAKALYGNLLTVPVGGGILYVEPIYTQRNEAERRIPCADVRGGALRGPRRNLRH